MSTIFDAENKPERFLTFEQLVELLTLKPPTLYDWMQKRRIPYYEIGKTIRFRLSDIESLLNRSLIPATAAGPVPVRKPRGKNKSAAVVGSV